MKKKLIKIIHSIQNTLFPNWFNLILGTISQIFYNHFDYSKRKNNKIKVNKNKIILYFADVLPKDKNAIIHGGKVKLLELKNRFEFNESNFSILYIVSSALPKNILSIVKWVKKNGVKIVLNQNGVAYPAWRGMFYKYANYFNKHVLKNADYVIYQSEFCKQSADIFLGKYNGPFKIIYNSIDIDYYKPAKNKAAKSPLILLLTGSHQAFYRVKLAILTLYEVLKKDNNVKLIISGRLDWKNAAKETGQLIKALNMSKKIEFIGPFKQTEAPMIYKKAHILLHTKYNDPCPTVVIEALACGLPVVTTKSGGLHELIGDDAGICVDVVQSYKKIYDPVISDLCDAVIKIKNDLEKYSNNARNSAIKYFSSKEWIKEHKKIFEEVLAK